jgi:hypothetical protein
LAATDDKSGVAKIEYQVDGNDWIGLPGGSSSVVFSDEGIHTVRYRAIDNSKNVEDAKEIIYKIDKTAPTLDVSLDKQIYTRVDPFQIHYTAFDAISGIDFVTIKVDGIETGADGKFDIFWSKLGIHTVEVVAHDRAGWITAKSISFELIATFDSLLATHHELFRRGEISPEGILNGLDVKINQAKDYAAINNVVQAIRRLKSYIAEVNGIAHNPLSDRGAEILLMDVNYLISKLK